MEMWASVLACLIPSRPRARLQLVAAATCSPRPAAEGGVSPELRAKPAFECGTACGTAFFQGHPRKCTRSLTRALGDCKELSGTGH
jgi:hypothetical protein